MAVSFGILPLGTKCFGVLFKAVTYFDFGRKLTVITDHKSIKFFLTSNFKTARLNRWIMSLKSFISS